MSKILIVIDMQNDFVTGSLGTKEAAAILPAVAAKIAAYTQQGYKVLYTRDTHEENYLETREGQNLPVKHCIKGTWGWELVDEVQRTVVSAEQIYDKGTFGSVKLAEAIKEMSQKDAELEVELIGLCTDICVVSNALLIKAYLPEMPIKVDAQCCAGVTVDSHLQALATMKMCQVNVFNEE